MKRPGCPICTAGGKHGGVVKLSCAARILGYRSTSALRRLAKRKQLFGAFKVGAHWRVNLDTARRKGLDI